MNFEEMLEQVRGVFTDSETKFDKESVLQRWQAPHPVDMRKPTDFSQADDLTTRYHFVLVQLGYITMILRDLAMSNGIQRAHFFMLHEDELKGALEETTHLLSDARSDLLAAIENETVFVEPQHRKAGQDSTFLLQHVMNALDVPYHESVQHLITRAEDEHEAGNEDGAEAAANEAIDRWIEWVRERHELGVGCFGSVDSTVKDNTRDAGGHRVHGSASA